jgi:hypothetical protein
MTDRLINSWLKPKLFLFLKYNFVFDNARFNEALTEYEQWLKANPIQAKIANLDDNKTIKYYTLSSKQKTFTTNDSAKIAKWLSETKLEKTLIQYHKRKIPSVEKTVYHFLALDYYWNKQANKVNTTASH